MIQSTVNEKLKRGSFLPIVCHLCILILLLPLSGCERRDITYYLEAEVEIHVDWSQAELNDKEANYGATVVFYPEDGGTPRIMLMGNRNYEKVRLPQGRYNVIIFNRSFDDFANVNFRGKEHYETLEAYASKTGTRIEEITDSPEALASDCIEGFEVTEEMLGNYSTVMTNRSATAEGTDQACSLCFKPLKLIKEMKFTLHVKGLNNVRSACATIDGVSASVFLASRQASRQTVTQRFDLGNKTFYSGSPFDGTMDATFNSFNFNADDFHTVRIEADLVDGKTTYEESFDEVAVDKEVNEDGKIYFSIKIETSPIPDVKPEGGSDSGFDVDVGNWGDEINSDIII